MTTRPCYPPYLAVLTALAERDGLTGHELKAAAPNVNLGTMLQYAWILSERVPSRTKRPLYRYHLTDVGRQIAETGLVEVPDRTYNRRWTATEERPARFPSAESGPCVHYWRVESTIGQPGVCQRCGATKLFAPLSALRELATVGGGRVERSERYA